ncbi:hypothetical protein M8J77_021447 [Diaphorina citri]|nr:hypothetical protein M8J77_021447 [Diaphorina citri]
MSTRPLKKICLAYFIGILGVGAYKNRKLIIETLTNAIQTALTHGRYLIPYVDTLDGSTDHTNSEPAESDEAYVEIDVDVGRANARASKPLSLLGLKLDTESLKDIFKSRQEFLMRDLTDSETNGNRDELKIVTNSNQSSHDNTFDGIVQCSSSQATQTQDKHLNNELQHVVKSLESLFDAIGTTGIDNSVTYGMINPDNASTDVNIEYEINVKFGDVRENFRNYQTGFVIYKYHSDMKLPNDSQDMVNLSEKLGEKSENTEEIEIPNQPLYFETETMSDQSSSSGTYIEDPDTLIEPFKDDQEVQSDRTKLAQELEDQASFEENLTRASKTDNDIGRSKTLERLEISHSEILNENTIHFVLTPRKLHLESLTSLNAEVDPFMFRDTRQNTESEDHQTELEEPLDANELYDDLHSTEPEYLMARLARHHNVALPGRQRQNTEHNTESGDHQTDLGEPLVADEVYEHIHSTEAEHLIERLARRYNVALPGRQRQNTEHNTELGDHQTDLGEPLGTDELYEDIHSTEPEHLIARLARRHIVQLPGRHKIKTLAELFEPAVNKPGTSTSLKSSSSMKDLTTKTRSSRPSSSMKELLSNMEMEKPSTKEQKKTVSTDIKEMKKGSSRNAKSRCQPSGNSLHSSNSHFSLQ